MADEVTDLPDLYHGLAAREELVGFAATERFYEIETPAALAETSELLSAKVKRLIEDLVVTRDRSWGTTLARSSVQEPATRCAA